MLIYTVKGVDSIFMTTYIDIQVSIRVFLKTSNKVNVHLHKNLVK